MKGDEQSHPTHDRAVLRTVTASSLAGLVAAFWGLPTTLYCWDGARNVMRGPDPDWGYGVFLVLLGLLPWALAVIYVVGMHRRHGAASSLAFGALVLAAVTLPVLFVRVTLGGGF